MLTRSARHILMVDHTKFGNTSLELVCNPSEIDILVTDMAPEGQLLEALRPANVEIVIANAE